VDCHGKTISQAAVKPAAPEQGRSEAVAQTPEFRIDPDVTKSNNEYLIWQNSYTRSIFDHQSAYTLIIFIVVNLLVLAGLYFAWVQFNATLHLSRHIRSAPAKSLSAGSGSGDKSVAEASPPPALRDPGPWTNQQLKLGPDGVAISSSFIGLIILGFSMGFYLMYLQYVYPIRVAGPQNVPAAVLSPNSSQPATRH